MRSPDCYYSEGLPVVYIVRDTGLKSCGFMSMSVSRDVEINWIASDAFGKTLLFFGFAFTLQSVYYPDIFFL